MARKISPQIWLHNRPHKVAFLHCVWPALSWHIIPILMTIYAAGSSLGPDTLMLYCCNTTCECVPCVCRDDCVLYAFVHLLVKRVAWGCRWWREAEGFKGRFAVIFPIDRENVTFVASAPIAELHKQGLPFNPDEPRSVQADLANADNLKRCMTVFHDFDERLLTVLF